MKIIDDFQTSMCYVYHTLNFFCTLHKKNRENIIIFAPRSVPFYPREGTFYSIQRYAHLTIASLYLRYFHAKYILIILPTFTFAGKPGGRVAFGRNPFRPHSVSVSQVLTTEKFVMRFANMATKCTVGSVLVVQFVKEKISLLLLHRYAPNQDRKVEGIELKKRQ